MEDYRSLVAEVKTSLKTALEDEFQVWFIVACLKTHRPNLQGETLRQTTLTIIREMLEEQTMVPITFNHGTIIPWRLSPGEVVTQNPC